MEQLSIFDFTREPFRIDKPVRMVELFAGYGSQALAMKYLGVPIEHHLAVEFDKYACASYNAVHDTDFPVLDVCNIHAEDLKITDTDKYCYILTYSFPCTDLSVAGKMQGMAEGSGTRSSLLWEVRRILSECKELPQILLMENVTQVHSTENLPHFKRWLQFLESLGYSNYVEDCNAKQYCVAQNRDRCFVLSLLGEYNFKFPHPVELRYIMKDYLEDEVDEKYYLNSEKAQDLIDKLIADGTLDNERTNERTNE